MLFDHNSIVNNRRCKMGGKKRQRSPVLWSLDLGRSLLCERHAFLLLVNHSSGT